MSRGEADGNLLEGVPVKEPDQIRRDELGAVLPNGDRARWQ
ncbi:hypothetical protein [Streptomyces sp. NBC_00162]|nr:hypothetical protein [Streptomyces sp. NBC_00162]UUU37622.1 hypothetical protein JIW86_01000 [Streptomyces sp. NBC_00162]